MLFFLQEHFFDICFLQEHFFAHLQTGKTLYVVILAGTIAERQTLYVVFLAGTFADR